MFKEEFETYYIKNFNYFINYINKIIKNKQTSEDICQETFTRLFNKIDDLRPDTLRNYFLTISKNLVFTYIKHNKTTKRCSKLYQLSYPENPMEILELKEAKKIYRETSLNIPLINREVLFLKKNNFKYREMAEILGISIKTVEKRVQTIYQIFDKIEN